MTLIKWYFNGKWRDAKHLGRSIRRAYLAKINAKFEDIKYLADTEDFYVRDCGNGVCEIMRPISGHYNREKLLIFLYTIMIELKVRDIRLYYKDRSTKNLIAWLGRGKR